MSELESLKKWRLSIQKLFEHKKGLLLIMHSKNVGGRDRTQLINEINMLAKILLQEGVNEENIAGSLRVYPNRYK